MANFHIKNTTCPQCTKENLWFQSSGCFGKGKVVCRTTYFLKKDCDYQREAKAREESTFKDANRRAELVQCYGTCRRWFAKSAIHRDGMCYECFRARNNADWR